MNTNVFSPCDLKSNSETVYCPMFKEQGMWFRDELFTTLEEAEKRQSFRKKNKEMFGFPVPEMRIVKSTFELIK